MVGQATTDALFADFFLYCNVIQVGFSKGAHKLYDPEFTARVPQLLDLVLQSWTKVLGTVLQYSDFSVISLSLLKQCILFEIFLQFSLPHPIQSWNSEKILDTRVQHCLWGEGRGWTCVNWKTPQKRKSVPRLLSMIVASNAGGVVGLSRSKEYLLCPHVPSTLHCTCSS